MNFAEAMPLDQIICGDCLEVLRKMPSESIDCCVTSPPYFGLRDYGVDGQIGLEKNPGEYVSKLVEVFGEVRRVLKDEGTLWLNLGDSYAGSWGNYHPNSPPGKHGQRLKSTARWNRPAYEDQTFRPPTSNKLEGLKNKDLIGIPWMVAFALRADGWWLRSDIIWHKPNCMPESVTDRPTKAHEYIFLLSKSERYFYDIEAIKEDCVQYEIERRLREEKNGLISRYDLKVDGQAHAPSKKSGMRSNERKADYVRNGRNKRTVWTVPSQPFKDAHFATFPEALVEPCIKAGCPESGIVLDPFFGAGTTGLVAKKLGRRFVGIEVTYHGLKAVACLYAKSREAYGRVTLLPD